MSPGAIIRRLDHINILVERPGALFSILVKQFELPPAWPVTRFPGVESGGVFAGNVTLEAVAYAPGRKIAPPRDAGPFALAFEPVPLEEALAELQRRGIPHSPPFPAHLEYPEAARTELFEATRRDTDGALWTLVFLGGVLGDKTFAERYSSRAATSAPARAVSRVLGRLNRYTRIADRLTASTTPGAPFAFLCDYHVTDPAAVRQRLRAELEARDGGPLGLRRVTEVVIGSTNPAEETARWQRLLDPLEQKAGGRWDLADGPALRVVEDEADRIQALVCEVSSLSDATHALQERGMDGEDLAGGISIAPASSAGTNIRLVERPAA